MVLWWWLLVSCDEFFVVFVGGPCFISVIVLVFLVLCRLAWWADANRSPVKDPEVAWKEQRTTAN